jgi:hypothetical protein
MRTLNKIVGNNNKTISILDISRGTCYRLKRDAQNRVVHLLDWKVQKMNCFPPLGFCIKKNIPL